MMTETIQYRAKIDKIIETILYLAHQNIELSRYKIVKLVYLADRAHLNRYRRPITYDRMIAMQNGPVPSATYNILKQDQRYGLNYAEMPFDFIQRGDRHYIENPKRPINERLFSKSDLMILDEITREHGGKTFAELYDMTHQHKGYVQAWEGRGDKKSNPIRFEDLIDEGEHKAEMVEHMKATCRHVLK